MQEESKIKKPWSVKKVLSTFLFIGFIVGLVINFNVFIRNIVFFDTHPEFWRSICGSGFEYAMHSENWINSYIPILIASVNSFMLIAGIFLLIRRKKEKNKTLNSAKNILD